VAVEENPGVLELNPYRVPRFEIASLNLTVSDMLYITAVPDLQVDLGAKPGSPGAPAGSFTVE